MTSTAAPEPPAPDGDDLPAPPPPLIPPRTSAPISGRRPPGQPTVEPAPTSDARPRTGSDLAPESRPTTQSETSSETAPRGGTPGLTSAGVYVLLGAAALIGAVASWTLTDGLGPIFTIFFVAGTVYVATQVRRSDLWSAVIAPPLVFLVLVVTRELVAPESGSRALVDIGYDIFQTLALMAPTLWGATALGGFIIWWRFRH